MRGPVVSGLDNIGPMRDIRQLVTDCFAAQGLMHTLGTRLVSVNPAKCTSR